MFQSCCATVKTMFAFIKTLQQLRNCRATVADIRFFLYLQQLLQKSFLIVHSLLVVRYFPFLKFLLCNGCTTVFDCNLFLLIAAEIFHFGNKTLLKILEFSKILNFFSSVYVYIPKLFFEFNTAPMLV